MKVGGGGGEGEDQTFYNSSKCSAKTAGNILARSGPYLFHKNRAQRREMIG